jgi:hypothetical protein
MTPGWNGAVVVRIETPRGVHAAATSARGLPWPSTLPPLAVGEWCAVSISGAHGRSAEAAYLRASPVDAGLDPDFLSVGLPALACLRGGPDLVVATLRAGLVRMPDFRASATMTRARER